MVFNLEQNMFKIGKMVRQKLVIFFLLFVTLISVSLFFKLIKVKNRTSNKDSWEVTRDDKIQEKEKPQPPQDFPVYHNSVQINFSGKSESGGSFVYETTDPANSVFSFYNNSLKLLKFIIR